MQADSDDGEVVEAGYQLWSEPREQDDDEEDDDEIEDIET